MPERAAAPLLRVAGIALVALAAAVVLLPGLLTTRLWEDEAYNLTVPLALAHGNGWTSAGILSGGIPTPFDAKISTGPVVLLPIVPLLLTGMDAVLAGRLVVTAFAVLLLVLAWRLGVRVAGVTGGVAAALAVLIVDASQSYSPIRGLNDVLGEVPAAALTLAALVVFARRPAWGGLLLGLAIQCKLIAALSVPALVVVLLLLPAATVRARLLRGAMFGVGVVVPSVLWELVKLVSLGFEGYRDSTRDFYYFFRSGGQSGVSTTWGDKAAALANAWGAPGLVLLLLVVVTLVGTAVAAARWRRSRSTVEAVPLLGSQSRILAATAAGVVVTWIAWWFLSSSTPVWVRYPAPALLVGAAVGGALLVALVRSLLAERGVVGASGIARVTAAAVAVALLLTVGTGIAAGAVRLWGPAETLADQRQVAAAVPRVPVVGAPWGPAIPIAFLAGARPVLPGEGDAPVEAWILPPGASSVRIDGVDEGVDTLCGLPVVVSRGFTLCAAGREGGE